MKSNYHKNPEAVGALSPEQYQVTQKNGTERPFTGEYWDNHEPGIYVDVVSGEPLFSSVDKFDSGSGWPSFTRPIESRTARDVEEKRSSCGAPRCARRTATPTSATCSDGPGADGQRYCINSAALRFVRREARGGGVWPVPLAVREDHQGGRDEDATSSGRRRPSPAAASGAWRTSSGSIPA